MNIFHKILKKYWGYTHFRPLQEDIITSIYNGKDTLGLMPTGGGKSITFQVPALAMDGICLVITPLVALMKDQVDNLKSKEIKALYIHSGMSQAQIATTLDNAILGDYKFLYVSPERLGAPLFRNKLKQMNICLLAIDESHCISQWGYDFRPSYMNIADIRTDLPQVPVLALTATATPEVTRDIQDILKFKEHHVFRKSFRRENLTYIVRDADNKLESLIKIISKTQGSTIVYVRSRIKTKEIAEELMKNGFSADYYHAGLDTDLKSEKQNAWKNNEKRIMVATNAFGMGIDKPDVRLVVHLDLPNSLEEYYQEAGRAGRDEQKAYALIFHSKQDSNKLKKRIIDEFPERDFVIKIYEHLAYFFQVAEGFGLNSVHDFDLYKFCSTYKFSATHTHNALKILELAGYIEYTDESDNRSRVQFRVYRDDLYKYDFTPDQERLINIILRLYTGVFADYVTINENVIAHHINKTRNEIYHTLKYLSQRGILDYIPYKRTPFIIYKHPRIETKHISISKAIYELRKQRFENRILAITDYVERNDVCRSKMLLSYFGEINSPNCGKCDVCLSQKNEILSKQDFDDLTLKIDHLILNKNYTIEQLTETIDAYSSKNIIETIRLHIDNERYSIENDFLKLIKQKE